MVNELLIKQIKRLVDETKKLVHPAKEYKLRTYRTLLREVKRFDTEITSSSQLEGKEGIGPGSLRRIDEILETGTLEELPSEEEEEETPEELLQTVIGIGKVKAEKFVKMGIKTPKELYNEYKNGNVKLSHDIVLGLKYYDDIQQDIPRREIDKVDEYLKRELKDAEVVICGSYRRGALTSGDIDVLITTEKWKPNFLFEVVERLHKEGFLIDDLSVGNSKYMGFCKISKLVRRIDIRYFKKDEYPVALLYFTGDRELNIRMRRKAKSMNMTLNEYELMDNKTGKAIKIDNEEDIFNILGMKYIPPFER